VYQCRASAVEVAPAVAAEQLGSDEQRLQHEQPCERLTHDRRLRRDAIAHRDGRPQLAAQELAEPFGAAGVRRELQIFRDRAGAYQVVAPLDVLDPDHDEPAPGVISSADEGIARCRARGRRL
jgi:hypothetical protein